MAVGGMIGGGIFSVLGVTVAVAGHAAFGCFVLGGAIALLTAHAYATLSLKAGRSGGPFVYLRDTGRQELGALVGWLLILGYVVALAVYAFTFGHYFAHVVGATDLAARIASVGVMVVFFGVNLRGIGASALSEDAIVLVKLAVLGVIACVGITHFSPARLAPVDDRGLSGIVLGAASIFVAYEGFELLAYDYDDIDEPRRTLPRSLYLSVSVVITVYLIVTIGSQMLVSDALIVQQKEVAFATVGQQAFGTAGRWFATLGALLATCSAINATLFSTARQMRDMAAAHELPARLERQSDGLPVTALAFLAVLGAAFAMLPGILEVLAFGSATFLSVFALVNLLAARAARRRRDRIMGYVGAMACGGAIVALGIELYGHDRPALALVFGCLLALGLLRVLFVRLRAEGPAHRER
jgi:amino acid transporter